MARRPMDHEQAIYVISVAAELAGVHPQTLRVYERKGLVSPSRTAGNTRRYSESDIALLRRIQELTNEGINLAGVVRILELEDQLSRLHARFEEANSGRAAMSLVPLKDIRRIRRAMKSDAIEEAGKRRVFPAGPTGSHGI